MLSLPKVEDRPVKHYVALRRQVTIPFGDVPGPTMDAVVAYLDGLGVKDFGPAIFKYNVIAMPKLEIEMGFLVSEKVATTGEFISGELPAGKYAATTWIGHYDQLMEANAVLIGWGDHHKLNWDVTPKADGDHFAARVETYFNGPDGDPAEWETEVAIKLK